MFQYLHSWVTNTNEGDVQIKARIINGHIYYHALGHLLQKIYITQLLEVCLYEKDYMTDCDLLC
jgi:hypothetical protein